MMHRSRRERQATETRIGRSYEVMEDGDLSVCDPKPGERLAEYNRRPAQPSATERSHTAWLVTGKRRIDAHAVERFGALIRQQMTSSPQFRRAYVQLPVAKVVVAHATIDITGSVAAMEAALGPDHANDPPRVPIFDREWCRLQDSNL
ncbi:hypothetical protein SPHINGO361_140314 [Sphingomonas sp. EC-HK361]|nr:hypothetical protein SPHINGO361_140314 [Sphingomonas sp. EC-HK361]